MKSRLGERQRGNTAIGLIVGLVVGLGVALGIAAPARAAWIGRLAAAGHPIERSTAFTIYTRDPDGCLVALSHHPVPAP